MKIPAPEIVGASRTMAILAAPGMEEILRECIAQRRVPVLMHELGGEKERAECGPREMVEISGNALGKVEGLTRWAAGASVRTTEDAAHFSTAGYTWFSLELANTPHTRAAEMTLEQLDAGIVAQEDRGFFQPGWHEDYVDREVSIPGGTPVRYSDEALARIAVKFGPMLAEAEQMDHMVRTCSVGHGEAVDIIVSLAPSGPATTPEEMVFLVKELRKRLSKLTAIAPALGQEWGPGADNASDAVGLIASLQAATGNSQLALPAGDITAQAMHVDATEGGRLAILTRLAREQPAVFREWLEASRIAFPIARHGWPISLSEEEARFLPQVEDGELEQSFLHTLAGRQLLLTCWRDVRNSDLGRKVAGAA